MNVKSILLILAVVMTSYLLPAQKPKPSDFGIKSKKALDYYFEGKQQAQWRDWYKSIEAYQEAVKLEPEFAHAHFELGVSSLVKEEYEGALEHLEKAYELRPADFPSIDFYLAEASFFNAKYDQAAEMYESFLTRGKGRKQQMDIASKRLRKAGFASEAIQHPVAFSPVNLGSNINTDRDEYLPYLTADDQLLLFTSRRQESIGGFNPRLKDYSEDFYFCEWVDGEWTAAANLGPPINTPENEGASFLTQDGKTIYFTACNRPDGIGSCDLYVSYREGNSWSEPENLGPRVNSTGWESQPCLSHDGTALYFASGRPGGQGGRDLWRSKKVNGNWTEAENLGNEINTLGNEDAPFLHADGISLYFSSDYHPGFGSKDLFVSYHKDDGTWTRPENLGYPLNTVSDESNIFVSANGKRGFINSYRDGGFGRSDIYEFTLDERIRPKVATFLRGVTRDSLTRTPVQALIHLIDVESGDTVRQAFSGRSDGKFLMSLPLDRQYAAFFEAKGYLFASKDFYLKQVVEDTYFDMVVDLVPIRKGVEVVLRNIFFESGKYELQETSDTELQFMLRYLKNNPRIRIEIQGHTDDVGSDVANLNLSQARADAVRSYLLSSGIDKTRIEAKGYGETQPVADNQTEAGRAQNRRTAFKILDL